MKLSIIEKTQYLYWRKSGKPKHGFSSISLVVSFSMKNFKRTLPLLLVLVYIGHDKLKEKLFLLQILRVTWVYTVYLRGTEVINALSQELVS
jgi:hypothetical protein